MKAAARSKPQIADRVRGFGTLGINPIVELHLFGSADVFGPDRNETIRNCRSFSGCEYIVHFPILDPGAGYIYDPYNDEKEKLMSVLDFCKEIEAQRVIMHRCFGFNREVDKLEAEEKFLDRIAEWNRLTEGADMLMLIENYGFVWLPDGFDVDYITSPLDHFFPWDLIEFRENLVERGFHNVGILLDVAHAVLSSNMFNMLKIHPELRNDGRFRNIGDNDLSKRGHLSAGDFVLDFIDYFHVSDSFVWNEEDGIGDIKKYLYSEGLPIGGGSIDYRSFFKKADRDKTMIMEIDPANGDYANNTSQVEAIEFFRAIADKGDMVCA